MLIDNVCYADFTQWEEMKQYSEKKWPEIKKTHNTRLLDKRTIAITGQSRLFSTDFAIVQMKAAVFDQVFLFNKKCE